MVSPHFGTLAYFGKKVQLLRATKNKEDNLDNHKDLRGNQELEPGSLIKIISYGRQRAIKTERNGYLMHRNLHRESNKLNKQRNMFQMKEDNKTLKTDFKKLR